MMYTNRRWGVGSVASAEDLAHALTERTWCLCTGFYVEGHPEYLFLNDATCEDGAGEWAVLKGGLDAEQHIQIESITFSWCSYEQGLTYVRKALAGEMDASAFARIVQPRMEPSSRHRRCRLCE